MPHAHRTLFYGAFSITETDTVYISISIIIRHIDFSSSNDIGNMAGNQIWRREYVKLLISQFAHTWIFLKVVPRLNADPIAYKAKFKFDSAATTEYALIALRNPWQQLNFNFREPVFIQNFQVTSASFNCFPTRSVWWNVILISEIFLTT